MRWRAFSTFGFWRTDRSLRYQPDLPLVIAILIPQLACISRSIFERCDVTDIAQWRFFLSANLPMVKPPFACIFAAVFSGGFSRPEPGGGDVVVSSFRRMA